MKWLALTFISLLLVLQSCITQEQCNKRYPPQVKEIRETTYYKRDSVIPGSKVTDTLRITDIQYLDKTRIIRDTTGRTELRLYKDAYGRLIAECEAKGISIEWLEKVVKNATTEVHTVKKKYIPWWIWVIFGIIFIPALLGSIKIIKLVLSSRLKFL